MKLTVKNNWENLTYYFEEEVINKPGVVVLSNGDKRSYFFKEREVSYQDMGNTYEVVQHVPYIQISYNGAEIEVELSKMDIKEINQL